jgi:hypothetical protein
MRVFITSVLAEEHPISQISKISGKFKMWDDERIEGYRGMLFHEVFLF